MMYEDDIHKERPKRGRWSWSPDLSEQDRLMLLRIAKEGLEEHQRSHKAAVLWLKKVLANEQAAAVVTSRLRHFSTALPKVGVEPDFASALAYAIVSDTLHTPEFQAYAAVRGFKYWSSLLEQEDITRVTRELLSLEETWALPTVLAVWHQHIMSNIRAGQSNGREPTSLPPVLENFDAEYEHVRSDALDEFWPSEYQVAEPGLSTPPLYGCTTGPPEAISETQDSDLASGGRTSVGVSMGVSMGVVTLEQEPLPNDGRPRATAVIAAMEKATLLQDATKGKIVLVFADNLAPISGILFTGPKVVTVAAAHQEFRRSEDVVIAHLLTHLLLSHVEGERFNKWREYLPGRTPKRLATDARYSHLEAVADKHVVCLLDPQMDRTKLTPFSFKLVEACRELIGRDVLRGLFQMRLRRRMSLIRILRAWRIKHRSKLMDELMDGQLVTGDDRHVYFIRRTGNDLRKHWIQSYVILEACCLADKELKLSDNILRRIKDGVPITTMEEAHEIGLPIKCKTPLSSRSSPEEASIAKDRAQLSAR